jgi:internalin A
VNEWIKMVRLRAFDETRPDERPRILVVATHGGPKERSAHIDEQVLRDEFGDLIAGFHHVDSQPNPDTGVCPGLEELKAAIAREAAAIPSVGRSVPTSWKNLLDALQKRSEKDPYISYAQFQAVCRSQSVSDELGTTYAAILNELGYLIHYAGDEVLQDTVILKAEYISKAISYVLEDHVAKQQNRLVEHQRLTGIWDDPERPERERYPEGLHRIFLRLMDRFDLSYQVVMPEKDDPPTSLVAQLVPGGRPEGWEEDWQPQPERGDAERRRICRLVDAETGFDTTVEGLLYRLIVRLHRYSLGKANYFDSRHWKTGMILDDGINGRALVEEIGGTIQVTVRAAYPDGFLGGLCHEVRALVDQFWKGLDCRLSVPCHESCRGLHELEELVETKREGIPKVRCSVCKKFHEIDSLLIAAAPQLPMDIVIAELSKVRHELADMKKAQKELGSDIKQMIGQANEQFDLMMNAMTSLAKDGPRLFSFHPVDRSRFNLKEFTTAKFRLTLWCEHARLPLHAVAETPGLGVYEVELTREWVAKAAPILKVLSSTLSLALPIAAPAVKLAADAATYAAVEDQLKFGKECASSFLKAGDNIGEWLNSGEDSGLSAGRVHLAEGSELRELHGLLKKVDPDNAFGGLARVQNKRREFLWVHPQFKSEY